jgi:outer membrane usher protein
MPTRQWSSDRYRLGTLCCLLSVCSSVRPTELDQRIGLTPQFTPLTIKALDLSASARNESSTAVQNAQLEVHLNEGNLHQTALVLIQPDGRVLVREVDLISWKLRLPATPILTHQNERYILLDDLGLLSYRVDAANQSLRINASTQQLLASNLNANTSIAATPRMTAAGSFLNYDVATQRTQSRETVGALLDLGIFANGGVLTTQILNRQLSANGKYIRLESTLTMDRPEQRASLRLGDAISRGGAWGRPVRFGGIQWGTNFATQPDFVTFPTPHITGAAALPSTAEVFINNVRTYKSDIQAGPFSINQLPVMTGQGEVKMVVRDLLGREQVIVQPYYAARTLLRRGLDDFSYEFGAARNNFSSTSNDYGQWLMAGTRRYGFTEKFTGEFHGEMGAGHQTAGLAGTLLLSDVGVLDTAIAASRSDLGSGGLLALGFDRQMPRLSFGLRTQLATEQFHQLGLAAGVPAPLRQTTAQVGWSAAPYGSVGLGYTRMDNRGQPSNEIVSASYSRTFTRDWSLGLYLFKSINDAKNYAVGVMLTHALSKHTTASVSVNQRNGPDSTQLQLQRNLPVGSGVGYRVLAGSGGSERVEGALNLQNEHGTYALQVSRLHDVDSYRASASGGIAVLGGQAFLARRLGDSFAVVRVPGYPNVQVYAENQPVGRTNSSGTALVPGLRPYQKNRIGIEQGDLPLDASVGALEINAVPFYRSGYNLVFPIEKARGAMLRVVMADGKAVPAGAQVHIVGREEIFPVAMDGQVYLSGLTRLNKIEVTWDGSRCKFQVPYLDTDSPLPDLGNFLCREIDR